jgi:aspartate-semialdehyde dehydrogenase
MIKLALVGATGLVGSEMLRVLEERFPAGAITLVAAASEKSVGKKVLFHGKEVPVVSLSEALSSGCSMALFSAGGAVSLEWAPRFSQMGVFVIDNSSAWRMHAEVPLVVPEINASVLSPDTRIIANPNCTTIQLVMALYRLHHTYVIKRLVVSTYQSVTGTGARAVHQLENERRGVEGEMAYPYVIDKNCIPQCDVFTDNGYTREEMKVVQETRKILGDPGIQITCTAVRVPVMGGHSESVNAEFNSVPDIENIKQLLRHTPGVVLYDHPETQLYPMPVHARGKDDVYVGRIRKDESCSTAINLWIVADNLRKGAATNAVQIAEILHSRGWVKQWE